MEPKLWQFHAAVFEWAQARGLRGFAVRYRDGGDQVEIALVLPPEQPAEAAPHPSPPALLC